MWRHLSSQAWLCDVAGAWASGSFCERSLRAIVPSFQGVPDLAWLDFPLSVFGGTSSVLGLIAASWALPLQPLTDCQVQKVPGQGIPNLTLLHSRTKELLQFSHGTPFPGRVAALRSLQSPLTALLGQKLLPPSLALPLRTLFCQPFHHAAVSLDVFPEDEGNLLLRPWSGSSPGQEGCQRCYLDRPGPFLCVLLDIPPSESNSQAWLCFFLLYDLSPTTVGSW